MSGDARRALAELSVDSMATHAPTTADSVLQAQVATLQNENGTLRMKIEELQSQLKQAQDDVDSSRIVQVDFMRLSLAESQVIRAFLF